MLCTRFLALLLAVTFLANCSQTRERTKLLNSEGPSFTVGYGNDYLSALNVMRSVYHNAVAPKTEFLPTLLQGLPKQKKIDATPQKLVEARRLLFAYVDARCDAYLDAIFWANRTRGGLNRGNDAIGSATTTILAATGVPTNVIGIVGAAFGLSGALVDNYYESVLYGLEPSSVRHLVSQSQSAVRAQYGSEAPLDEAHLLQQVQDYIRQCTPAHLDFIVNAALQETSITTIRPVDLPFLLFHTAPDGRVFRLRQDGTVLDPDGNEIMFGTGLEDPPVNLKIDCDGTVTRPGHPAVNYKSLGLADWEDKCNKFRGNTPPPPAPPAAAPAADPNLDSAGTKPE